MEFNHIPVLLEETIASLNIKPDGIYVDGTAGGGGHREQIARRLTTGRLIAIDQDPDALQAAGNRLAKYPQAMVVEGNFCNIPSILKELQVEKQLLWEEILLNH